MKNFSMPRARRTLRAALQNLEAPAGDFIDWPTFEKELEDAMAQGAFPHRVKAAFAHACTRARQRYHDAVRNGAAWAGRA